MTFTITTTHREITVQASNRKRAVHAAVAQLASGERVLSVNSN